MSVKSFNDRPETKQGFIGESLIARWLNSRGWNVLPAYQVESDEGKGPRLYLANFQQRITPDMLVFKDMEFRWIEAKTKSAFTWYRKTGTWQTGINRRHWRDYQAVRIETGLEIWILFLHQPGSAAKDTPTGMVSPSGLYGREILDLQKSVDHESDICGSKVYWNMRTLIRMATWEDIMRTAGGK